MTSVRRGGQNPGPLPMTTPERWQRVQLLCEALETVAPVEHAAFLLTLESDESLRQETLDLLEAIRTEEQSHGRPDTAVTGVEQPQVIGGVRVVEHIGSGGSGDVFRGVRTVHGTDQPVAVKCFHAHRASHEHLDRFAREQQMLVALTHPDIVRFLDAGVTPEGRPYLVMELAEGQPISTYCDERRLKVADRLRLLVSVCDAVQSAHQRLIVHLDLKPSNIQVSREGRVKLLDFGTAKLVDPLADFTRTEPLTLLYASPERLRGEPVSVACDVYSLGLILYELVSGAWPFRQRTSFVSVAERAAGHLDLVPLASSVTDRAAEERGVGADRLRALLRGDIEAIAAKALAHQPSARYASVADLADDLRRYLSGRPVQARKHGIGYSVGKFIRRRAWAAAGVATLAVGLASAAIYSTGQARAAEQAASRARAQNQFLTSLFTITGTDSDSRSDMTVRELLTLAEARVSGSLGADRVVASDVEAVLAQGFISQNAYPQARAILERVTENTHALGDVAREAGARAALAYVSYVENHNRVAAEQAHAALALWDAHRDRFTPDQAAVMLASAAGTLSYLNPTDRTPMTVFKNCLDVARQFPADVTPGGRAICLQGLAFSYMNLESRYDEAEALLSEAVVIQRADPASGNRLATSLQLLGLANRYRGRVDEDERAQRESLEIVARLQGPDSRAAVWQRAVWVTSLAAGPKVEDAYKESVAVLAAARRFYPERGAYLLWTPLFAATSAACLSGRMPECESLATEALETLGPTPADDDARVGAARGFRGLALVRRGRYVEAKPLLEAALAMHAARKRTSPYLHQLEAALAEARRAGANLPTP